MDKLINEYDMNLESKARFNNYSYAIDFKIRLKCDEST